MISVDDLVSWLGDPIEPNVQEILTDLEVRAVAIVETEIGRTFAASAARTEYLVGHGFGSLRLNENPATITSVHERQFVGDAWDAIVGADDDGWELRVADRAPGRGRLLRKAALSWLFEWEYRVIYDFGYTPGAEPSDIRQAVMDLVAFLYRARGREGLKSWSGGNVSWTVLETTGERAPLSVARTIGIWRGTVAA